MRVPGGGGGYVPGRAVEPGHAVSVSLLPLPAGETPAPPSPENTAREDTDVSTAGGDTD